MGVNPYLKVGLQVGHICTKGWVSVVGSIFVKTMAFAQGMLVKVVHRFGRECSCS